MSATAAERTGAWEDCQAGGGARPAQAGRHHGSARAVRRPAPTGARPAPLRLVTDGGRPVPGMPAAPVRTIPVADAVPPHAVASVRTNPVPVRLTRRGRIVVTAAALVVIAALSVVLAGAAQALGHSGGPARLGPGITKVQVRPGQDLWSLAEAYDPNADARQVIQEILQLNSMSTDQVQPGQVLWMPRD